MLSEFQKEKVLWTRKMNLNLVKFIHKRPSIWNPKHPKYTSSQTKNRTFVEFAAKYGHKFSGQAVKERWTNIRSTFAYYLRKVKTSLETQNEVYKVTWPLWEPCQFLLKVNKNAKLDGPLDNDEMFLDTAESEEDCKSDIVSYDENNETKLSCQGIAENIVSVFKGLQNDAFGLNNSDNSAIGKAVTEKLSQLDSLEASKMCIKILEVLYLYDKNNPSNPNNSKSENILMSLLL